jgi:glyoxylase-like metal-dependent hydrolase (beta-lactamase superfamily II)
MLGLLVLPIVGCGNAADGSEALGEVNEAVQSSCLADPPIVGDARKVFQINDHLTAFYDGRNTDRLTPDPNWVDDAANKLGVATYAIHQGNEAIVVDTFPTIAQAQWQRSTLEAMGITHFTVVTTHWHNDHIAGNEVYADSEIVMTARGRQFMVDLKDDLEAGTTLFGPPAINPVILPTQTYVGSKVMHVGCIRVELNQINIHSPDETVIVLPQDRLLLSGDTTEDTETFMVEYADLKIHSANLKAMKKWKSYDRILPNHGNPDRIEEGGYDKSFITATADYIDNMVAGATKPNFLNEPLEAFAGKALRKCEVSLFEPYRDVHEFNKQGVASVWAP